MRGKSAAGLLCGARKGACAVSGCVWLYHASPAADITVLEPRVSNHGVPRVYFSRRRENVLVYLSNAIEKYCRETGFAYAGPWQKWGPYGFTPDGLPRLEEYYPDALEDTYRGVCAYIYRVRETDAMQPLTGIPDALFSEEPVPVAGCERIDDAYEAILQAQEAGTLAIRRFGEIAQTSRAWLEKTVRAEYAQAAAHPEYRHFLRGKFFWLSLDGAPAPK